MQELFLNYRWPVLWQQLASTQSTTAEQSLWKAALLAAWWQGGEEATRLLPPLKTVLHGRDSLPIFITGLVALCLGDGQTLRQVLPRLTKMKAPAWMGYWLMLEEAGRRRQFAAQATLLKNLPVAHGNTPWPYIACLQSLDQKDIDPQPMLQVLSTFTELPALAVVLHARLLTAAQRQEEAIALLKPLVVQGTDVAPVAAYHLGFAAAGALDLTLALRSWDFAAQHGFMDRPSLHQWLSMSLSCPAGWGSTPERVAHAEKLCSVPDLPQPERSAAALSSYQLIFEWIEGRFAEAYAIVARFHRFQNSLEREEIDLQYDLNGHIFFRYVLRLCAYWQQHPQLYKLSANVPTLHCLGESHSLSPVNAVFNWQDKPARGKAHFVMGIKMWHLASPKGNFHKSSLRRLLHALPKQATLLFCIGEIDCRPNEGIWWQKPRYPERTLAEIIDETVTGYLNWLSTELKSVQPATVTIQGVPAPGYALEGRHDPGDKSGFLAMIRAVNAALKAKTLALGWQFLDVYSATANDEGLGNGLHHLDGFHLQPGFYQEADRWLICPPIVESLESRQARAIALAQQALALRQAGGNAAARIACYREAWRLLPEHAEFAANLASALSEAGEHQEAEAVARQALALDPTGFAAGFNLGVALDGQARHAEAAEAYERAAAALPKALIEQNNGPWVMAWSAAGNAWRGARHALKSAQAYQRAVRALTENQIPQQLPLLAAYGEALEAVFHFAAAEQVYRQALAHAPDDARLLTGLGDSLRAQQRLHEARACFERVLALCPDYAFAYGNLGIVYQQLGQSDQAVIYHRQALSKDPTNLSLWNNAVASMAYAPSQSPLALRQMLDDFDRLIARPLQGNAAHANPRAPNRRLKVGYVSADFRRHPVAYFALPLIAGHRREDVEVYCYYSHLQSDEWTERLRAASDHWRDVVTLHGEALAKLIREDGIDILVDLGGHTEGNRLTAFARKPAPVQVTWMGYVTTTGMRAMDWRITHADADPEGTEDHYSERLYRLPGTMWCYQPLPEMPTVLPAPTLSKGYVTFASFNRYSKNSPPVLAAWADILRQVSASQLLIYVPEGGVRDEMLAYFVGQGIDAARIRPFDKLDHAAFWALHGEVDIALDPFPFGGGTTTCETLWLGVPVVTCTGEGGDFAPRFASRMGKAFLTNIGHPELVASTIQEYVEMAVALARDRDRLAALRQSLRTAMADSPLTDTKRFVSEMEAAYRAMWLDWLNRTEH